MFKNVRAIWETQHCRKFSCLSFFSWVAYEIKEKQWCGLTWFKDNGSSEKSRKKIIALAAIRVGVAEGWTDDKELAVAIHIRPYQSILGDKLKPCASSSQWLEPAGRQRNYDGFYDWNIKKQVLFVLGCDTFPRCSPPLVSTCHFPKRRAISPS